MSPGLLKPDDLEAVRGVFRSEVLTSLAPAPPLPAHDLSAEDRIAANAIAFDLRGLQLSGLRASDFYSALHGSVFEIASIMRDEGATVSVEVIVAGLRDQGYGGPVERTLLRLRDEVPAVDSRALELAAARVVELSNRRALCRLLARLDAQLKTDAIDFAEACAELADRCYLGGKGLDR